jgi:basic membrane protein A and related proteins
MRRLVPVLAAATVLFAGCAKKTEQETAGAKPNAYKVGLVFDVGGRGDKSFNDAAYAGLDSAKKDLGIQYESNEPGEGGDRESALRQFASGADDLIIGVGFLFSDDVKTVAKDFPHKKFACVDMNVAPGETLATNVVALKFKEEEGSYLVGALSGLLTKTHVVGFLGGMQIPLIKKFEVGYTAGVHKVSPQTKVLVKYAGATGQAFKDPTKGKELGLAMYGDNADIVFHASGSTGLGLFEAAKEKNALAIGVDSDQNDAMPGHVLTSMVKRVDVAVYETIKQAMDGQFPGGQARVYGLKENGVGYVYDARNANLIPAHVKAVVDSLGREIIAGKIQVPSE